MADYTEDASDNSTYPPETRQGTLQLQFDVSENTDVNTDPSLAYRLRVSVVAAENIDSNIFVYEAVPDTVGRDASQLAFVSVATPAYMQELPIAVPTLGSRYLCRLDVADLYYPSVAALDNAKQEFIRRTYLLLDGIEKLSVLRKSELVSFTFDTDEGGSSTPA